MREGELTYEQQLEMMAHLNMSRATIRDLEAALRRIQALRSSAADLTPWGRGYHTAIEAAGKIAAEALAHRIATKEQKDG